MEPERPAARPSKRKFGDAQLQWLLPPLAGAVAAALLPLEEKTDFTVVSGRRWCQQGVRSSVSREITGLGLKAAKDLVDGAPKNVKEAIVRRDAEAAVEEAGDADAKAELCTDLRLS